MERLESILVAVDRSAAARGLLDKAIALAQRYGARLELFHCDAECAYELKHEYASRGVSDAREDSLAASRRYLEELIASSSVRGLRVTMDVACESPLYEGIVRKTQESCPDLVIRNRGGDGTGQRIGLSATDWALVRTCPAPLLLTSGRSWKTPPRIAAAIDISGNEEPGLTSTILRTAAFLSSRDEGSLEVIHGDDGTEGGAAALDAKKAALRQRVEEARVRSDELHVLLGEPSKMLPEFAAGRGYDVLVLGALTHRKELTALVGTLTGRLMDKLACDFLVVKPETYVCPVGKPAANGVNPAR